MEHDRLGITNPKRPLGTPYRVRYVLITINPVSHVKRNPPCGVVGEGVLKGGSPALPGNGEQGWVGDGLRSELPFDLADLIFQELATGQCEPFLQRL